MEERYNGISFLVAIEPNYYSSKQKCGNITYGFINPMITVYPMHYSVGKLIPIFV